MLSERQRQILSIIVEDYIRSAEPVGSRTISKREDVTYSPATIRNEMSDLEELGFLEQPHTSAGRVPSHKGYRYYVDHLVQVNKVTEDERTLIKSFFAERINQIEQVAQLTATTLSNLTNYTSIVLGPEVFHTSLKHIQFIPLNDSKAVAILVTSTGHVENKTVTLPEGIAPSDVEKVVNILNAKLTGVPLYQLRSKLYNEIGSEISRYVSRYEELMAMVESALQGGEVDRVFLGGTTNILTQPEFKDVDKVKTILDLLEEQRRVIDLISTSETGLRVRIGTENMVEAVNSCSLITATYSVDGKNFGTLGILGPTRMDYAKVMALIDYFSKDLTKRFERWYK
ncbi:heat-inducible transcriptional repressor HrcA [Paenibacillus turpanensis]|uniref:heat-inducible transcriptional repressor HrcA n=1 Tax=Paenibacillus turpanensis TaxID=2689078 RepID=UPI00140E4D38